MTTKDRLIASAATLLVVCAMLSYFVKPKAPVLELVSPIQELPEYEAPYPGDTSLSDRISKSYALALILVHTPYTQKNVNSLENIRSWARESFHRQPDFLHPSSLPPVREGTDTVFGAGAYNLFAQVHYWLQEIAAGYLKLQMARFHDTSAYTTFNAAYFDLFGKDADAATLLARYQSDRAKDGIDVLLWAVAWFAFAVGAVWHFLTKKALHRHERLQQMIGATWALLSVQYFVGAWTNSDFQSALSSAVSAILAAFLLRPLVLSQHAEIGTRIIAIKLGRKWVAVAGWVTFTLLSVQVLTWIRSGIPNAPDPVTLILCSITGNFIHDPVHAKRLISQIFGCVWLVVTAWAARSYMTDDPQRSPDADIRSLVTSYAVD